MAALSLFVDTSTGISCNLMLALLPAVDFRNVKLWNYDPNGIVQLCRVLPHPRLFQGVQQKRRRERATINLVSAPARSTISNNYVSECNSYAASRDAFTLIFVLLAISVM
jgi:hypothetical protein